MPGATVAARILASSYEENQKNTESERGQNFLRLPPCIFGIFFDLTNWLPFLLRFDGREAASLGVHCNLNKESRRKESQDEGKTELRMVHP